MSTSEHFILPITNLFEQCVRSAVLTCNQQFRDEHRRRAPDLCAPSFQDVEREAIINWMRIIDPQGKYTEDALVTEEQRLAIREVINDSVVLSFR